MATYPNKPWSDGQTYEVVPGETFIYNASQSVWEHVTKATLDSDFQVDKAALEADISSNTSDISTNTSAISALDTRVTANEGDITTLQAQVSALDAMSDSDALRIQQNLSDIQNAYSMLDSDGSAIQSLQTQIDALNTDNLVIETDHDSDITALAMPVISATQPTGKAGLLWVNLNDGKMYYWNVAQEVFTEIVAT